MLFPHLLNKIWQVFPIKKITETVELSFHDAEVLWLFELFNLVNS